MTQYLKGLGRPLLSMSSDGALEKAFKEVKELAAGTFAVNCSSAGALAFTLYDITLTFGDEVRYIWPSKWSLVKCIFLFIRYFTLALQISVQFTSPPHIRYPNYACYIWNIWQAVGSISVITAVDYILILRVYALYPRNRVVKFISGFLYLAEVVMLSAGMGLAIPQLVFYDEFCAVTQVPRIILISTGAPIAFQAVLFVVTTWKFVEALRMGWGHVGIVGLLMRDGTWAFFLLFLVLLGEATLFILATKAYTGVIYCWLNSMFSFCGYRIILNLSTSRASREDDSSSSNCVEMTVPRLEFASNTRSSATGSHIQSRHHPQFLVSSSNQEHVPGA